MGLLTLNLTHFQQADPSLEWPPWALNDVREIIGMLQETVVNNNWSQIGSEIGGGERLTTFES